MTEGRPRWATFSVKSHIDLDALTLDVRLYDALVFPTPYDTKEVERWGPRGVGPDQTGTKGFYTQLGDLACR